jgi:tetratricopeptide (TPR) repeat protein
VAYQQAVDAGHLRALFELAEVSRRVTGGDDATLAFYQQAAASTDPELAAEALDLIVGLHLSAGDAARADEALRQVVDAGRPNWVSVAVARVASSKREDEPAAAEALYRQAIDASAGHESAYAAVGLGELLEKQGDIAGAKAVWRKLIDTRDEYWADGAFLSLVNLLRAEQDVEGLRALHQAGVELDNPDALYALDQLGEVLTKQGDIEGAHAAWQQAIDAGYERAADLRERISPPPQRRRRFRAENYPPDLPPAFNPGNMRQTATEVLDRGRPALPPTLTPEMAIPMAYWKGEQEAVVLILDYSWEDGDWSPMAWEATFTREGDSWIANKHWHGGGWSPDPIIEPRSLRDPGDRPMVTGGGSSRSRRGQAAPTVTEIGLIQNGHEIRRPIDSHFGAWVVWTDQPGPFTITGYDSTGTLLASIESEDRPGRRG